MKKKLQKVEQIFEFETKRNVKLITPCCNKFNKDGKFANYKHLPEIYGYCHSCGKTTLPPSVYLDDKGAEYIWNDIKSCYEPIVLQLYHKSVTQCNTNDVTHPKTYKYIPKELVLRYNDHKPENNLLVYIRRTYGDENAEHIKKMYYIGSSKDGGTIFWNINKNQNVQKAKVSYYTIEGKRTNKFKVPYKNKDGYFSCLFGEHLINLKENIGKSIVLVESEKTAIICALHIPEYVWLSYGGINGLTKDKLNVLINHKVILVPDVSENAVFIMKNKLSDLLELGIEAKLWDMTNGKLDEQLKEEGWYNCDLEDVFREFNKTK